MTLVPVLAVCVHDEIPLRWWLIYSQIASSAALLLQSAQREELNVTFVMGDTIK